MRVLHLPQNIASIPSHTVRGLRKIGIDARGLIYNNSRVQSSIGIKVITGVSRNLISSHFLSNLHWCYSFIKEVAYADIIHWYFGSPALPLGLDLKYLKLLKKPCIVEWLGSDIRIPEIEFSDNPYYKQVFYEGYEYRNIESLESSFKIQKKFADAGFATVVSVCMMQYVFTDIWSRVYVLPQRLFLSDYSPIYPNPETDRPVIVHAPTAPYAKGTFLILEAIEKLKTKYKFDFYLLQGIPHYQAIRVIQTADIFLDQFILGTYGMAAIEAMALGKPVLCYIKPSMINKYPKDCPIINANPQNIADVLEILLNDGQLRFEIGKQSRAYVEKYHDAVKLSIQLLKIYQELVQNK